jgi:hypothetical protein
MVDPPPEISLLSLSLVVDGCLVRMALSSVNGGAPRALGLKILRVQERGGGRTDHRSGPGRPAQAHPSPVRSSLHSRGSSGNYALCPFHFHDFDDVILASKMEVLRARSSVLRTKLSSRLDKVVWGIFWKVFRRSCGPPTRSVGPTNRSAGLLVGRTHLSGTTVSLVGGDPGVPMSHKPPSEVYAQRP